MKPFESIEELEIKRKKLKEIRPLTRDERKVKTKIECRKEFLLLIEKHIKIPDVPVCNCCKGWIEEVDNLKKEVRGYRLHGN